MEGEISARQKTPLEMILEHPNIIRDRIIARTKPVRPDRVRRLPVLLLSGESGTGKSEWASSLDEVKQAHGFSYLNRIKSVNMAALPSELQEHLLFGYEKGAFTGAYKRTDGFFQAAQNGTLFLDEIGEATMLLQAKLLRALPKGGIAEVTRVGNTEIERIPLDLVVATNRNLSERVKEKQFREDLFHRLNVVCIHFKPLRSFGAEIREELAKFFLDQHRHNFVFPDVTFTPDCLEHIGKYDWPGNIREVNNAVYRALLLREKDEIITDSDLLLATPQCPSTIETTSQPSDLKGVAQNMFNVMLDEFKANRLTKAGQKRGIKLLNKELMDLVVELAIRHRDQFAATSDALLGEMLGCSRSYISHVKERLNHSTI